MHVGVLCIGPDCGEVGLGKAAKVFADGFSIEGFVDGGGAPFGFEDDIVF